MAEESLEKDEQLEQLVAYLDGEVDDSTADSIESQMSRDQRIRQEVDSLQRAWDMLDLLDMPKTSQEFSRQTIELATKSASREIVFQRPKRKWVWRSLWVSALIASFGLGLFLVFRRPSVDPEVATEYSLLERLDTYQATGDLDFLKRLEDEQLLDQMDQLLEPGP